MPGLAKLAAVRSSPGSAERQGLIQENLLVDADQRIAFANTIDSVWGWFSAVTASAAPLGRGSTDTNIGTGQFKFYITGQAASEIKAAVAAGTAIGAQTVPADTWACYALDAATGGTITVVAAALNTTGYATEALAFAARPAKLTAKARLGYITLKTKAATAWVAATDALAGGSSGNPASVTNYYPHYGIFAPVGVAPSALINVDGATTPVVATAKPWSGGWNGVMVPTALAIGSTDTNLANTAFKYNANGVLNLAKAAVAAGTALGALGTIPADKWGVIAALIDTAGTVTYLSGPDNYGNGYATQQQAQAALNQMVPTAGLCMFGYITVKTKAATVWIAGTDALAGGATGNPASATNYYPTAGVAFNDLAMPTQVIPDGALSAAQIANPSNLVLAAVNA